MFHLNKWYKRFALSASQMSLIIFKLVFNTFIPKEDHVSKCILENHWFL